MSDRCFCRQTLTSTDHSELTVNLLEQVPVNIQIVILERSVFYSNRYLVIHVTLHCPARLTVICCLCPFVWVVCTLFMKTLV